MHRYLDRLYKDVLPLFTSTRLTSVSSMYIIIRASLVLNICSSVAWCRPYPRWYFTIFYFQCFLLAGLRLRFFWYVFPQDRRLLGCYFGRWFLIIPCFFLLLLWPGRQVRLLFLSTSLLSLGYPSPAPPSLFLTGYFDAQVSVFPVPFSRSATSFSDRLFWRPGIHFPVPFSRSAPSFSDRLFWRPGIRFPVPCFFRQGLITALSFWCPWSSFSTPSISQPTIPYRLFGWPDRSLYRLAVHLCFYRSALGRFLGALLFRRPPACCPPIFAHFRAQPVVPARP